MIYLAIFIGLLILIYYYDWGGHYKERLFWFVLTLVIMICVTGLRYRIGTDSIRYENEYKEYPTLGELKAEHFKSTRYAPLYILFNSLCRTITPEFMLVQFMVSIFINSVVFWFLYKNTRHIFFGAFLYYIFLYLNLNTEVLREAMAVGMFLLSWPFFQKGRWWAYYPIIAVACLFHVSAFVLLLLPVVTIPGIRYFFTFGKRTWIICIVLLGLTFAVKAYFFDFIQVIALTENMAERAEVYSKKDIGGAIFNFFGFISQFIRVIIYPLIAMLFIQRARKAAHERINDKKEMVSLVSVYFGIMTIGIAILLRYNNYFLPFSFIVISNWAFSNLHFHKKTYRLKLFYWSLIFLPLVSVQIYSAYFANFNSSGTLKAYMVYYPYYHRLDPQEDPDRESLIRYNRRI